MNDKGDQKPQIPETKDWRVRMDTWLTKLELLGVRAANKIHRGFVNFILIFIGWNCYSFAVNYNNYWRLRRDANIPRQWLEEQTKPGEADWQVERDRVAREGRLQNEIEKEATGGLTTEPKTK